MYRGTTPTIVFRVDTVLKVSEMKQIWVTFKSLNHKRTYDINEIKINSDDNTVSVNMSQEDTLDFCKGKVRVQIRFLDGNEKAYATVVKEIDMKNILEDGVICGYEEQPDISEDEDGS